MSDPTDPDHSAFDISFGAMTERLLSSSSQSFPVKKEIPAQVLKQLIDKSYDKRKQAGYDLHRSLIPFAEKGNVLMIKNALELFKTEYIENSQEFYRKAGLIAYSALSSTVMLNDELYPLVPMLIFPVLTCFRDSDSKIRYAAVESMYNISKICRVKVLNNFDAIFRPMTDLFGDNDANVKKAVEKLDSQLKTLVVECEANPKDFNSIKFMAIIREMLMSSTNGNVQKLLVSWIVVLDSIPTFSIIAYLPNYLEGLFLLLGSKQENVKKTSYNFLNELLSEVISAIYGELDLLFVMEILAKFAGNSTEIVRSEAITWTSELLDKSDKVLFRIFPSILKSALQCLADESSVVSEKAIKVNDKLMKFFKTTSRETTVNQYEEVMDVFMQFINHESIVTRSAILKWIISVQAIYPESIESKLGMLLETLVTRITEAEEGIFETVLQVLCRVAEYKGYFDKVMTSILKLFSQNLAVLENRGGLIITFFCTNLGTEAVYKSIATILSINTNQKFTEKIIALLNELILTDPGLESFRERLKYCIEKKDQECIDFFKILFRTWCYNPISALSLAFLVQIYELTYEMLQIL